MNISSFPFGGARPSTAFSHICSHVFLALFWRHGRYLLGVLSFVNFAVAQDFRIGEITVDLQGHASVSFESKISAYYVLFRGSRLDSISTPIDTKLGTGGTMRMTDAQRRANGSFYRVQEVAREQRAKRDDNPTVPDVVGQFLDTKRHADYCGFYAGRFSGDTLCNSDCDCFSHYQGIVRGPGPGVPYLYVSKNRPAEILVIRMGSRDTDGERLRSNRLRPGYRTGDTWPLEGDGEVNTVRFDDLDDTGLGLAHAGGMQVVGQTLVVGIDMTLSSRGVLALLDLSNPEFPRRFYTQAFRHKLGGTALVKLPDDGRYLLLAAGESGAALSAYISNFTDLHKPGLFFEYAGQWYDPFFNTYQGNYNIVKQSDGELYVIGTYNPGGCYNPIQRADLWKLNSNFRGQGENSFSLTRLTSASLELSGGNFDLGVAADFQAAAGTYVSPSGELIIYGTVHQRGDPFTEFAEFRRKDIAHPTAQPWVELYSEPFGWASAFGRSVVLDVADRHKDDFLDFTRLDPLFDNSASSVRWWAPPGCCIELLSNPCFMGNPGTVLSLEGTGEIRQIASLATTAIGDNSVSGVRFCFDAATPYTCNVSQNCPPAACQVSGPDLIVLGIAADSCVNHGQSIFGTVTIKNTGNMPAFGFMDIGFSLSIDNKPSNDDIPMGILDLNLNPPLLPGQTRSFAFNTFLVPDTATPTVQNLIAIVDLGLPPCAMICESCEWNNALSTDVRIGRADVAITDLTYPASVSAGDLVPITVSMRNFGCDRVCNTVTACLGIFPNDCVTQPFCIEPFDTKQVTINVRAPASEPDCGMADNFSVSACLDFLDGDNRNNCRNETIIIKEPHWDLDLSISSGDNSAGLGDSITYTVWVTNLGDTNSPSCVSFLTGITCNPGPGQWGCLLVGNLPTRIGAIQPGEAKPFPVTLRIPSCCAPPIIIGQQWLKAEIHYTGDENCDDDCGEGFGNNFHQEPIQITN